MRPTRDGDEIVVRLDPGDLVVPVDVGGRWIGQVRPMVASGSLLIAEWDVADLAVEWDDGGMAMLGFSALLGADPAEPGEVAFTNYAPALLYRGIDSMFTVYDQVR